MLSFAGFPATLAVTLPQLESSSNCSSLFQGKLMQIATHNQDQPDMARPAAGTWFVLERMQGFSHLALACPGAAATK
jgi:hypothetical protein